MLSAIRNTKKKNNNQTCLTTMNLATKHQIRNLSRKIDIILQKHPTDQKVNFMNWSKEDKMMCRSINRTIKRLERKGYDESLMNHAMNLVMF